MAWQSSSCSLDRPDCSQPKTTAVAESTRARSRAWAAAAAGDSAGQAMFLTRALAPNTKAHSATASSRRAHTWACARMSSAPAARAAHSALGNCLGATKANRLRPMVFMARAAAPMLPGWVVFAKTIFTFSNMASSMQAELGRCGTRPRVVYNIVCLFLCPPCST